MNDVYCEKCGGSGEDVEKTSEARKKGECDKFSYIRCWNCNGNGLDPAKFFRWNSNDPSKN